MYDEDETFDHFSFDLPKKSADFANNSSLDQFNKESSFDLSS